MKNYVAAAIVINVLVILSVLALIGFLPPQVPLFYGLPEGQDQLATSWFLILPATTSLFILTSNLLITLKAAVEVASARDRQPYQAQKKGPFPGWERDSFLP